MGNSNQTQELSKSKAKRLERQKDVAAKKRKAITSRVITGVVIVAIVGCIGFFVGKSIYDSSKITKSISNYSQGINDSGLIDGVNVNDYLTLCDIDNLVVPYAEVEATAEEIDAEIESLLSSYKYNDDDSSLEVIDGDTVNINYVGRIDGEIFDGGSADDYNLTIGSGSFIDTFEEQLIGSHPGDEVIVNVTFPEDYSNAELANKPAEFTVQINGISVTPEFTDEFVAENLSDVAASVDDYKNNLADNFYKQHLQEYLANYIVDESAISSYPKSYLKTLKGLIKYNDENNLSYYNSLFASYGISAYDSLWAMRNLEDEAAYEEELTERAQDSVKQAFAYQALYEKFNLSVDFDAYCAELNEINGSDTYADTMLETYGKGYMMQAEIEETVMNYLMDTVTVQ